MFTVGGTVIYRGNGGNTIFGVIEAIRGDKLYLKINGRDELIVMPTKSLEVIL